MHGGGLMRGMAIANGAALMLWAGGATLAAQNAASEAPAKMSGIWKLNKDLSTDTSSQAAQGTLSGLPGSGDSGRGGGGSGGGGYGGGRRAGGRSGGRGGFGGGRGAETNQETLQLHALMREVVDAPEQLAIVATSTNVSFTDDQGRVRKYAINDKKAKIDLGTAEVDCKTRWDADVLRLELTGGPLKVTETYQVTVEGHQLVVTITREGAGRGGQDPGAPIKRIYDRVE